MKDTLFTSTFGLALWLVCVGGRTLWAQDTDRDGVPDAIEAQLLATLAPVWMTPVPGHSGPLPIDWNVRHSFLLWYTSDSGDYVDDTGGTPLTPQLVLDTMAAHRSAGLNYHYRFGYHDTDYRFGDDPNDPMSWAIARDRGIGLYGRVTNAPNARAGCYLVQYFLFFGWNETDTPPGCDAGNHEGDWICVQFEVEASDLANPRIYDCVFHNHGRQTFVESPAALEFDGTHPRVYLEHDTNEPWPFAAAGGFQPGAVRPCVSTNKRFYLTGEFCTLEYETDCNLGYTAVREHEAEGPAYLISAVVNVGEAGHPYPSSESRFFQGYDGWWGNTWETSCYWIELLDTSPPNSPRFNPKMWDRAYDSTRIWPSCDNQSTVFVNFSASGVESGSPSQPFNKLSEALAVVASGGTITLAPGSSGERLTIFENCTITASGGTATIGQ
jgi:hypothetical protein